MLRGKRDPGKLLPFARDSLHRQPVNKLVSNLLYANMAKIKIEDIPGAYERLRRKLLKKNIAFDFVVKSNTPEALKLSKALLDFGYNGTVEQVAERTYKIHFYTVFQKIGTGKFYAGGNAGSRSPYRQPL